MRFPRKTQGITCLTGLAHTFIFRLLFLPTSCHCQHSRTKEVMQQGVSSVSKMEMNGCFVQYGFDRAAKETMLLHWGRCVRLSCFLQCGFFDFYEVLFCHLQKGAHGMYALSDEQFVIHPIWKERKTVKKQYIVQSTIHFGCLWVFLHLRTQRK